MFLLTTVATSATGFLVHSHFGAAHVVGVSSLAALAVAILALYVYTPRRPLGAGSMSPARCWLST